MLPFTQLFSGQFYAKWLKIQINLIHKQVGGWDYRALWGGLAVDIEDWTHNLVAGFRIHLNHYKKPPYGIALRSYHSL